MRCVSYEMFRFGKIVFIYGFFNVVFAVENSEAKNSLKTLTGKLAKGDQFPFVMRLYSRSKDTSVTYCTATVISSEKLLTAGHCCHVKGYRIVVSGDPDHTDFVSMANKSKYVVHRVKRTILHPGFERSTTKLVHDLCLLFLEKPLDTSHGAIRISYRGLDDKKNCTALGWGSNFGYELQHKLYYKQAIGYKCDLWFGRSSKYEFVCLEPHSVCPGDSGGPLVCDSQLYGIASFFIGNGNDSSPRCEEGIVDYYSQVASEKDFIEHSGSPRWLQPPWEVIPFFIFHHFFILSFRNPYL